jgi:2-oxoglutarate dehydrogenase E1 component
VDQFLAAGEHKWHRQSGLTLLLPHGYDGQGPEHSSCRVERFLQMSNDPEDVVQSAQADRDARRQIQKSNMQIVNCSTPANYFHVLRRQLKRNFRKPLVVVAPKNLLRLREAASSFADMRTGTYFRRVMPDSSPLVTVPREKVRRLVLCTGKVYSELDKFRTENPEECGDVAVVRVEQLAPFPYDRVAEEAYKYPNAELLWVQEEPRNMGAWAFVHPRIETAVKHFSRGGDTRRARYLGRLAAAAPAVGSHSIHEREQAAIVSQAFSK